MAAPEEECARALAPWQKTFTKVHGAFLPYQLRTRQNFNTTHGIDGIGIFVVHGLAAVQSLCNVDARRHAHPSPMKSLWLDDCFEALEG
jgi:hypothetical protein